MYTYFVHVLSYFMVVILRSSQLIFVGFIGWFYYMVLLGGFIMWFYRQLYGFIAPNGIIT